MNKPKAREGKSSVQPSGGPGRGGRNREACSARRLAQRWARVALSIPSSSRNSFAGLPGAVRPSSSRRVRPGGAEFKLSRTHQPRGVRVSRPSDSGL